MFGLSITYEKYELLQPFPIVRQCMIGDVWITIVADRTDALSFEANGTREACALFDFDDQPSDIMQNIVPHIVLKRDRRIIEIQTSSMACLPLFYIEKSSRAFYCSTHVRMLRAMGIKLEEDREAVVEYLYYKELILPQTLFKNIRQCQREAKLHVSWSSGIITIDSSVLPLSHATQSNQHHEQILKEVKSTLVDSLLLLNSYASFAGFLYSGGLDSSVLYALAKREGLPLKAYTAGYPSELALIDNTKLQADKNAQLIGAEHAHMTCDMRSYQVKMISTIAAVEEPLSYPYVVGMHLLFGEDALNNKKILISGHVADALFGIQKQADLYALEHHCNFTAMRNFKNFLRCMKHKICNEHIDPDREIRDFQWLSTDRKWVLAHFNSTVERIIVNRMNFVRKNVERDIFDQISLLKIFGSGFHNQLEIGKIGWESGKIIYFPYAHPHLISQSFLCPHSLKFQRPKEILCRLARAIKVPQCIISSPKKGLFRGDALWSYRGGSFELLIALCKSVVPPEDMQTLQTTKIEWKKKDHSHLWAQAHTLWDVINYALWKRLIIDNEDQEKIKGELYEAWAREVSGGRICENK